MAGQEQRRCRYEPHRRDRIPDVGGQPQPGEAAPGVGERLGDDMVSRLEIAFNQPNLSAQLAESHGHR